MTVTELSNLPLHKEVKVHENMTVTHVVGGWIYRIPCTVEDSGGPCRLEWRPVYVPDPNRDTRR